MLQSAMLYGVLNSVKLQGEVHPRTGYEGPDSFGARWGWVVSAMHRPLYPQERDGIRIV